MTDLEYALDDVLDYLDTHKIRATYKAVSGVTGINHRRGLGQRLAAAGGPSLRTSWVVQAATGRPSPATNRGADDRTWWHPDLENTPHIIRDPDELRQRITDWKAGRGS